MTILALAISVELTANPNTIEERHLSLGSEIEINGNGQLWIEKAKIVKAFETSKGFKIRGLKPGSSMVKMGTKTWQVHVLSIHQDRTLKLLRKNIKKTFELDVQTEKGAIVISGKVMILEELILLNEVCQKLECDFQLQVEMPKEIQAKFQKQIEKDFLQHGLAPQKLIFSKNITSLVGKNSEKSKKAAQLLKNWGIIPIESEDAVQLAPLIKIQITVAEIRKDMSLKYGVQWPTTYKAQILPSDAPAKFGDNENFGLNMLESQGLGKILASPTILCRSGKNAEFIAGGEFPIKIINTQMQDVIWKRYGIILKISPIADFSGKMSVMIDTEVSSIDPSRTVDQIPALFTNRLQSHFDLSQSRVIALSGLIKSEQGQASQGFPGLSRIPILGSLFSSQEFKENRTELVIFVKPEVVSPGSLEAEL